MDDERRYAGSKGALFGFLAALVFVAVVSIPILFAGAWAAAHCEPMPLCERWAVAKLVMIVGVVAALALLLGLAVRALVRWAFQRHLDPRLAGRWPPLWAVAVTAGLCILALWVAPPLDQLG